MHKFHTLPRHNLKTIAYDVLPKRFFAVKKSGVAIEPKCCSEIQKWFNINLKGNT